MDSQSSADDDGQPNPEEGLKPSKIALEIERLRAASVNAAKSRAKLPQPLFWSLFSHAIGEVRRKKSRERELREMLGGTD